MIHQRRSLGILVLAFLACLTVDAVARGPSPSTTPFTPDPAAVQQLGPAYRYPQAGWIVLHIEGEPYERGYQYGKLLAPEILDYIKALANYRNPKGPVDAWRDMRLLVNVLFLRRYDAEYLEEMKGIADGAAAAGAKFDGRALDLVDIVTINSSIEIDFLDGAIDATPTGLEGRVFREPPYSRPKKMPPAHCSAFAATGPATADGKVVFGHITMWNLYHVRHFNVWLDIKPSKGHRVAMQTFPGGIMSGMDYYQNDAGLLVAETTIRQTHFDINGWSLVSRIRAALQYADSIDKAVEILGKANNGLYTNEWLLADTKTDEIAMFELGTKKSKLWRSSKNEWLAGTEGFYWGCNNAKDLQVRLETIPSVAGKPANLVFRPSDRDVMWIRLYEESKGKIDADFGFRAFTTPPIAGFPSCDAKFTTTALAKEMKSWALFGPPLGKTWDARSEEREQYPDIQPLVSNDWALLAPPARLAPRSGESNGQIARAVDLTPRWDRDVAKEKKSESFDNLPAAWHGSILPKTEADTWLAAAFADYEKIVALENALKARSTDGQLSKEDKDRLSLALFAPRSRYMMAHHRLGRDVALTDTRSDPKRNEWYHIAAGKGVLVLAELRRVMGSESFAKMMDEFGRRHAGKEVTVAEFREHAEKMHGRPLGDFLGPLIGHDLRSDRIPLGRKGGGYWSITSFEAEPEKALIVYGMLQDVHAQREAAQHLQREIARRWCNFTVPIKADKDVTETDLKNHHLLLVGRPATNAVAAKITAELPLTFGPQSFVLRGETYAHPRTCLIVAGRNPNNIRYSAVVFAGLSADATWRCVQSLGEIHQPAEALLIAVNAKPRAMVVPFEEWPPARNRTASPAR